MKITSLTGSGKVRAGAISPDGKVVVHAIEEGGKQSLWVRQVATGSDLQIVPSGPPFRGVAITPDGNYVYYTRSEREFELYSLLYQVPVLGGPPRKLIFDVDTPVTFSPDGKQIAFTRGYPQKDECAVMVAQADGTGERAIAVRKEPEDYQLTVVAWSPSGKTIAAVGSSLEGGTHASVVAIDVSDGSENRFDTQRWDEVNGLAWLPDGSGLVVVASTKELGPIHQIWLLSYPGGAARRITNDLNNYEGASLTADSQMLVTVQMNFSSNLCLAPAEGAAASARTLVMERNEFVGEIRWSLAGPIVFLAGRNGSFDLWMYEAEGDKQKRLTTESQQYFDPVLSSDGTFILCTSLRNGGIPHVWRLDADGGNPTQLTQGAGEQLCDLSSDNHWLFYRTIGQQDGVWRMPVAGGEPVEIAKGPRGDAQLSRDGKYFFNGYHRPEGGRMVLAVAIRPAAGGDLAFSYDAPDGVGEGRWDPSSEAFTYIVTRDGVSNIWRQPLGEAPAQQITDFNSGRIFSFDWSPDGKQLAFSRGETVGDAVLLSGFR
jgi:TolB protein